MNLIRGSGPDGLSGMKPVRVLDEENMGRDEEGTETPETSISSSQTLLIRPLLTWGKRLDTEGFCHECGIEYRYDTMNEDTAFRRVRIRKILLARLEDFNPKIIGTVARQAAVWENVPPR